ncbi:MAG: hypothetical protein ACQETZ_08805 [Candidatus Fermentibacterota bacterium]
MRRSATIVALFLSLSLVTGSLYADDFAEGTLPTMVVRMRGPQVGYDDMKLPLLAALTWKYFDATNFHGMSTDGKFGGFLSRCDSAHIHYSLCAADIQQYHKEWADTTHRYWFRHAPSMGLLSDSCFARSDSTSQSIANYASAEEMFDSDEEFALKPEMRTLADNTYDHPYLWFFEVYDEAVNRQWGNVADDTLPLNDYVPNMYTQDTTASGELSMEEIEPAGIFSWQKWLAEHDTLNAVPMTLNFAFFHSIDPGQFDPDWPGVNYGDFGILGRAVRALMQARYQPPPQGGVIPDTTFANPPEFFCIDYYPFRYVDSEYEETTTMCDTNWVFLIEHCEEGMDSTMMNAVVDGEPVPVYFYAQTIGAAAGPKMHGCSSSPQIDYNSYLYRNPTPQEFRMLCNLALLHQAKGIFPYSLCSYIERPNQLDSTWNYGCTALLDRQLISFDAPYEEWVYTGRWPEHDTYDYSYVRPDSIPPWMDGFDPLYEIDAPPDPAVDPKYNERWYEWLFEPYGILWSEIGGIMAGVKRIAPEMHDLWYAETQSFGAYWDAADIYCPDSLSLAHYVAPEVRVLLPEGEDDPNYLFYVNRYMRADSLPVRIVMDADSFPPFTDLSQALDHSRRCFVEVDGSTIGIYVCEDTLAAGEGRLLELTESSNIQADLRVTKPDVYCRPEGWVRRRRELRCTAGRDLELGATFYNMSDSPTGNITVTFKDLSADPPTTLGTDSISLPGMDGFYEPDSASAVTEWETESADIGTHLVEISAESIPGEYTPDNSVEVTVLIEPRDYAAAVRGDPWDMTEDELSPPDWHTSDIESVAWNWDSSGTAGWTDSISGMFEGALEYDGQIGQYRGDIGLAIPADREEYIDTDTYHMLSLGMVTMNPNSSSEDWGAMKVRWKEAGVGWSDWCGLLQGTGYQVGNGRDQWRTVGPIDLDDVDGLGWEDGGLAEGLELSIRGDPSEGSEGTPPVDVRIGWVRLEETAP